MPHGKNARKRPSRPRLQKLHRQLVQLWVAFAGFFAVSSVALFAVGRPTGGCWCATTAVSFAYLAFWCLRYQGKLRLPPLGALVSAMRAKK